MSCPSGRPTFRLLDRRVGWTDGRFDPTSFQWVGTDPAGAVAPKVERLTPWDDPDGIRLAPVNGTPGQSVVDALSLLASLPPRRLALGCGPGSWLLLTPGGMVLRRQPVHWPLVPGVVRRVLARRPHGSPRLGREPRAVRHRRCRRSTGLYRLGRETGRRLPREGCGVRRILPGGQPPRRVFVAGEPDSASPVRSNGKRVGKCHATEHSRARSSAGRRRDRNGLARDRRRPELATRL